MKILWLCNIPLPSISMKMGREVSKVGGWLFRLSEDLKSEEDVQLTVCFPIWGMGTEEYGRAQDIDYCAFPLRKADPSYLDGDHGAVFADLLKRIQPDIVHIWGTEYSYSYAMVQCCLEMGIIHRVLISIQGLSSNCTRHYYADLPLYTILRFTLRDWLRLDNIALQKRKFARRGALERKTLQTARHVIGRTDWDRACVENINAQAQYYKCNETLRDAFYEKRWSADFCEPYSLFTSQSIFPLKGLHIALEALALVRRHFPAKLYIAGESLFSPGSASSWRLSSYAKHIRQMIHGQNLQDAVIFTGPLTEEQMCTQMLRANVFILPSAIENSPNSLGEAMMLGMPSVASFVGGVSSIFTHGTDGFCFPHDEPDLLAYYIMQMFRDANLAGSLAENAHAHASITHNRENNYSRMLQIYRQIGDENRENNIHL